MRGFACLVFAFAFIAGPAVPWSVSGNHSDEFAFAFVNQAHAQSRPRSAWRPVGAARGIGTVICNRSSNAFACFGIRCGKGRGTEFLFLFNRGDYGKQPDATLTVDGRQSWNLKFTEVVEGQELVSPFATSNVSEQLIRALKAGNTLSFNPGAFEHLFTLKKSSREINRVLAQCERNNGSQPLVSQSSPGQPKKVVARSNDLLWRENDTEQSYVGRIRKAAIPFGGACDEEQAIIERLQRDIQVSVDRGEVRAGETVSVKWSGNSLKEAIPVYLMVATDASVRFKGAGFYALMPGAIAPFGLETFKDATRAMVPLYGHGALQNGIIEIEGLQTGRIPLHMAVVGWQRKCQRESEKTVSLDEIRVRPSAAPFIELDVSLEEERADNYLVNIVGDRLIDEREDGTWQLLDADTLQPVVKGTGTDPRFSETGYFVSVTGETHIIVYDAVDGKELFRSEYGSVFWDNKDSFVGFGARFLGESQSFNTLNPENTVAGTWGSRMTPGAGLPTYDLENNLGVYSEGFEPFVFRIDRPEIRLPAPAWDENRGRYFFSDPSVSKELVADVKIDQAGNASRQQRVMNGDAGTSNIAAPRRITRKASETNVSAVLPGSLVVARSLQPDAETRTQPPTSELLEAFGLKTLGTTEPVLAVNAGEDADGGWREPNAGQIKFGKEIRSRILADLPQSKAYFSQFADYSSEFYIGQFAVGYAYQYELSGKPVWLTQMNFFTAQHGQDRIGSMRLFFDGMKTDKSVDAFDNSGASAPQGCFGSLAQCKVNVTGFADRYLVIWSPESQGVAVFDGERGEIAFKKFNLPRGDLLHDVRLTEDGNHVLQINTDGTFFVHRIADQSVVLSGRSVDDEVVVWTPDLHFDATAEGAHFVNLRFPGQIGQYTFQQFNSRLRVPGLVEQVLSGGYVPKPVEIGVPPQLSGSVDAVDGRISGTVLPASLDDLRSIRVYQDGVLSDEILALESRVPVAIDVERLPGARWVSLVAVDEEGLASLPVGRDLGAERDELAKVRLLAVGVDEYDDEDISELNFAKSDASRLIDSVKKQSGLSVELITSTFLSDAEASPQAILAAAEELVANSKAGEQLVFFFAGHGTPGEDGRYYLATSNTDLENISGTALSWDTLSATLRKSKARMTVFIDSCHSGSAGTDFFASNDDAVSGILKDLPSGLTVFAASKGREESLEDPAIGGGFFTIAVSNVIAGDRSDYDLNQNGMIEVSELYLGVKRQVTKQTEGRQTPWLARNQMVGDFALF